MDAELAMPNSPLLLLLRNPQGGTGEGGRGFQIEHISRDPESRGLSHA